ncbi:MAG: arginine--tRNA ligase, partial [Bacilli bacterium]|nr:arginine--tRNA ligase [Bacilli bacterium]
GQTGPYLQYTSVRISSILSETEFAFDGKVDSEWFESDHVYQIIKTLSVYQDSIERSVKEYAPSVLARYLLGLASQFNSFYTKEKVLVDDLELRHTKLHLLWMVRTVLNDGMRLLGMQIIEKM